MTIPKGVIVMCPKCKCRTLSLKFLKRSKKVTQKATTVKGIKYCYYSDLLIFHKNFDMVVGK